MNLVKNLSSPKTQKRKKRKSSHNYIIIIEFKFAKTLTEVAKMQKQGEEQGHILAGTCLTLFRIS